MSLNYNVALEALWAYGLVDWVSISVLNNCKGEVRKSFRTVPDVMPNSYERTSTKQGCLMSCEMLHSNIVQRLHSSVQHLYDGGNCSYHMVAVVSISNHQKITKTGRDPILQIKNNTAGLQMLNLYTLHLNTYSNIYFDTIQYYEDWNVTKQTSLATILFHTELVKMV